MTPDPHTGGWLRSLLDSLTPEDGWRCWLGLHRWHFHNTVGDWFCHNCRKRRDDLGVRR